MALDAHAHETWEEITETTMNVGDQTLPKQESINIPLHSFIFSNFAIKTLTTYLRENRLPT